MASAARGIGCLRKIAIVPNFVTAMAPISAWFYTRRVYSEKLPNIFEPAESPRLTTDM